MVGITTLYENILTEIKRCNDIDEPIWLTKLVVNVSEPRNKIICTIDKLIDFGMVEGRYGITTVGHAGYRYYITDIGHEQLHKMIIQ